MSLLTESGTDTRLLNATDPKFRQFIGKRIFFKKKNGQSVTGVANFIGKNFVTNEFQVTVEKTPIWPVDPSSIRLAKERE